MNKPREQEILSTTTAELFEAYRQRFGEMPPILSEQTGGDPEKWNELIREALRTGRRL